MVVEWMEATGARVAVQAETGARRVAMVAEGLLGVRAVGAA